ncbi:MULTISPECIES: sugar transferase [unclassified Synechococcus]|uniref:sugar transferase n=1 Tax=unclassified Synechococcus TaxID=2626047 RepID=UPI0000698F3A|nr:MULTISPECIES: sugar transferase [unclassified Synechococcus]EAQ74189.1 glucosyltransferase [Synechococcus sp. WH 5701]WFN58452.1 sugar transferase [Synechococcus sp. CCFWC 502]
MEPPTKPNPCGLCQRHGTLLIQLPPRLTVAEAVQLRDDLPSWLSAPELKAVVLDFGHTVVIDSSGIGALVGAIKLAQARSLPLKAWSVNHQVRLALAMTGLESRLPITDHTDAVVATPGRREDRRPPQTHPSVRSHTKRLIDIAGALVGLSITAALFVPIAIAIRWDSPGPILFSQVRCGWMGRRFRIWKFRSMVAQAEALKSSVANQADGAFFKNENDPRITRVGRILRKTSLDELPQFWNVLIGDMSLIGTRPSTPDEVGLYDVPNWQRFDVKPGLSGEWQVSGRSSIRRFEDVIALDLRYQQNWSLLHDLKLILRTILVVFSRKAGGM